MPDSNTELLSAPVPVELIEFSATPQAADIDMLDVNTLINLPNAVEGGQAVAYRQLTALETNLANALVELRESIANLRPGLTEDEVYALIGDLSINDLSATADVSLGLHKIVDLLPGTDPHDAVTVGQLAQILAGVPQTTVVTAYTFVTSLEDIAGISVIDGIDIPAIDITNEPSYLGSTIYVESAIPGETGLYLNATFGWVRHPHYQQATDYASGMRILVLSGQTYRGRELVSIFNGAIEFVNLVGVFVEPQSIAARGALRKVGNAVELSTSVDFEIVNSALELSPALKQSLGTIADVAANLTVLVDRFDLADSLIVQMGQRIAAIETRLGELAQRYVLRVEQGVAVAPDGQILTGQNGFLTIEHNFRTLTPDAVGYYNGRRLLGVNLVSVDTERARVYLRPWDRGSYHITLTP